MRKRWLLSSVVVLGLLAAACGDDDDEGGATTTAGGAATTAAGAATTAAAADFLEDTGKVTLLSAGEPEEVAAYQTIFDDMINANTEYKVEVVSAGDFEQQFQIQAEGGTLDVAAVPQPGSIAALVDKGEHRGARGSRVQHRRAERARGRVLRRARRVQRQALWPAHEHQPQEHGLVPEGGLRRRGLHRARRRGTS